MIVRHLSPAYGFRGRSRRPVEIASAYQKGLRHADQASSPVKAGLFPLLVVAVTLATVAACQRPRTVLEQRSPDADVAAFVVDRTVLDGPTQTLYIRRKGSPPRQLAKLPADNEACTQIVWTSDSRRVGFVSRGTDGTHLRLFGVENGSLLDKVRLAVDGSEVRDVQLTATPPSVHYVECTELGKVCSPRALVFSLRH
jgi:hypothetical protein